METSAYQRYAFGPFLLDPAEKVLLRESHAVSLPPKALETLLALVENPGHLIEKAELLQRVWPDTFVEEATLAQNIFTLRKALGDSPDGHEYIETVPKRGYRFVGAVKAVEEKKQGTAATGPAFRNMLTPRLLWIAVPVLVAMVGLGMYLRGRSSEVKPGPSTGRITLAVLPFQNLTPDPQQEYFSDGLTEEMITQLGGLSPERLGVIARTSAMHYKGTTETAGQIGRELGVDYLVEGSLRREGSRVRISAQLIRVRDQMHLWAETYERDLPGILLLEDEVSRAVAREIAVQLAPQRKVQSNSVATVNAEAYEAYLKGRYFLYKRNPEATQKAFDYFHQAVQLDRNFALAYLGIGDCYFAGVGVQAPDSYTQAETFARKALTIDESIAGAHSTIAYARMHGFDWPTAEREFRRASELDRAHPSGYYVEYLMAQGRFDETIALGERFVREDPVAILAVHGMGMIMFYARRYPEAAEWFHRALELDPTYFWSRLRLAQTKEAMRKDREALADFRELGPRAAIFLARSYARNGNITMARRLLDQTLSDPAKAAELRYEIALLYLSLQENEKAMAWLERAYAGRAYHMIYLKIDPRLDPLRQDQRFSALLARVGLAE